MSISRAASRPMLAISAQVTNAPWPFSRGRSASSPAPAHATSTGPPTRNTGSTNPATPAANSDGLAYSNPAWRSPDILSGAGSATTGLLSSVFLPLPPQARPNITGQLAEDYLDELSQVSGTPTRS